MTTAGLVGLLATVSAAQDGARIGHLGIVTHGGPANINVGADDRLSLATLSRQVPALYRLRSLLTSDARLDLYSCSVAAGAGGKTFIDALSCAASAAVFASDNPVGTVSGADLTWEYHTGQSGRSNELFSMRGIEAIPGLCLYTYTSPADITNPAYHAQNNPYANATDYNVGQCTWYVYGRAQETGLVSAQTLSSIFGGTEYNAQELVFAFSKQRGSPGGGHYGRGYRVGGPAETGRHCLLVEILPARRIRREHGRTDDRVKLGSKSHLSST